MLLVDCDRSSESLNPANTVIVTPMSELEKQAAEAAAAGGASAAAPVDTAMRAIVQLVQRLRAEANAAGGEVNVPAALAGMRREATALGFAPDAAGLAAFLQHEAGDVERRDRERKEAGLGGLLRRVAAAMPALRGKASLGDLHASRPYRDPAYELGLEALLAEKVGAANARMDAAMRGGR